MSKKEKKKLTPAQFRSELERTFNKRTKEEQAKIEAKRKEKRSRA